MSRRGTLVDRIVCRQGHTVYRIPVEKCFLVPDGLLFPCAGHLGWKQVKDLEFRRVLEREGATRTEWWDGSTSELYEFLRSQRPHVK